MGTGRHDGWSYRYGSRCHIFSADRRRGRNGFESVADGIRHDRRFGPLRIPDPRTGHVHRIGNEGSIQPNSETGQIVFADTVQTLTIRMQKTLSTIAHVTSTGGGALVKAEPRPTCIQSTHGQKRLSALGGGGSLNSAYSAVASVPGAYVIPGTKRATTRPSISRRRLRPSRIRVRRRSGEPFVRQLSLELGVIARNSEVQVYTGATPAGSQGQGLAGYINQVIRTGTYPGFADGQLGIATPTFYHRAMAEAGGATPDRLFSYYVGIAGYNQSFRVLDNENAASHDNWVGAPMGLASNISYAPTINYLVGAPASFQYFMGPVNYAGLSMLSARDTVVNLHFAIPHHNDGGRDDVQVLWSSESLHNNFYSNTSDITSTPNSGGLTTGAACAVAIGLGVPVYIDSINYNCPGNVGKTFTASQLAGQNKCVGTY